MTACLLVDNGSLSILPETAPDSCGGYLLVTPTEYKENISPFATFDAKIFSLVSTFLLVLIITGIMTGFIIRKMR